MKQGGTVNKSLLSGPIQQIRATESAPTVVRLGLGTEQVVGLISHIGYR